MDSPLSDRAKINPEPNGSGDSPQAHHKLKHLPGIQPLPYCCAFLPLHTQRLLAVRSTRSQLFLHTQGHSHIRKGGSGRKSGGGGGGRKGESARTRRGRHLHSCGHRACVNAPHRHVRGHNM